jgi:hypothetical protein
MTLILLHAPSSSPISTWLCSAGFELTQEAALASAIVFTPELAGQVPSALPRIACLPVEPAANDGWFVHPDAHKHGPVRAEAYAGDARALLLALQFVLAADPAERLRGPLRLTWLGSLGELHPQASPPIGTSIPLGDSFLIGRSPEANLCLRQGPHSDQNTVARRHALIEPIPTGARVRDLGSTNGTWLHGQPILEAELRPGDELAIAGTHRVRLDGAAPMPAQ